MGMDIINLNANLQNILDREDIEGNVKSAEEILKKYANYADKTMEFIRTRLKGRFLREQLKFEDLSGVGRFTGKKRREKKQKIFSFHKDEKAIEFYFRRKQYSFEEYVKDFHDSGREYDGDVEERMGEDFAMTVYQEMLTGKENYRHHSESALGSESRTIDHYLLEKVDILEKCKGTIFFGKLPWFPKTKCETVYRQK